MILVNNYAYSDRGVYVPVEYDDVAYSPSSISFGTITTPEHLCPDLLRYENIGVADGLRGRVVRAFFWAMQAWRPKS